MVARRPRKIKAKQTGWVDISEMEGVDLSESEDPAVFWGANWKAEMEKALAQVEAGQTTRFDNFEAFIAHLEQIPPSDADV
jgi:hypothetical protein